MVKKVDLPYALPNVCMICSKHDNDIWFDLEVSFEYYGVAYLCGECLAFMAREAGFELPDRVAQTVEALNQSDKYAALLQEKIDALEEIVDGYRKLDVIGPAISDDADDVVYSFESAIPAPRPDEGDEGTSDGSNEPSYVERLANVSSGSAGTKSD